MLSGNERCLVLCCHSFSQLHQILSAAWTISFPACSVEQPLTFSICRVCMFRFLSLLATMVHRGSCCVCAHYHCTALCCCSFRQAAVFSIICVHYTLLFVHHRGARQLSMSQRQPHGRTWTNFAVSHLDFGDFKFNLHVQSGTTSGTPG